MCPDENPVILSPSRIHFENLQPRKMSLLWLFRYSVKFIIVSINRRTPLSLSRHFICHPIFSLKNPKACANHFTLSLYCMIFEGMAFGFVVKSNTINHSVSVFLSQCCSFHHILKFAHSLLFSLLQSSKSTFLCQISKSLPELHLFFPLLSFLFKFHLSKATRFIATIQSKPLTA